MSKDPEFAPFRILRPFSTYVSVYNGQAANIPIMVTEGGEALDPDASAATGSPYSSTLLRGLPVPLGSRVLVWIPQFVYNDRGTNTPYTWRFFWRLRSLFDFNRGHAQPWHYPRGTVGSASSVAVIPAANQTTIYTQAEPLGAANALNSVSQNVRVEDYRFGSLNLALPLIPTGATGQVEQGVPAPAIGLGAGPSYLIHEMQAAGDELLIGFYRPVSSVALWELQAPGTTDLNVNTFFSNGIDAGVLVTYGASP